MSLDKRKVSVTVVFLERYQENIPRGDCRKKLENERKIKKIFVTRSDSPKEVKAKISWAFRTTEIFTYLECVSSGTKLILSSNQQMNGKDAMDTV